jgi:hypothetical protein
VPAPTTAPPSGSTFRATGPGRASLQPTGSGASGVTATGEPESSTPLGLFVWAIGLYVQGYGLQLVLQAAVIGAAVGELFHRHTPH